MPTLTIDGKQVTAKENATVLEAARVAGVSIPTLCHHEAVAPWGGCRLCMVDVTFKDWDGWYKPVAACLYPVAEGLIVETSTERIRHTRKVVLDLLLARCPDTPLIKEMAKAHGVEQTSFVVNPTPTDCILCGLCTRICDAMGMCAISATNRGIGREIAPPFNAPPADCVGCLACAVICPTGYIKVKEGPHKRRIWDQDFEMLKCKQCGKSHITVRQADYFAGKNGVPRSYFEICDACKRRKHAETFASLGAIP